MFGFRVQQASAAAAEKAHEIENDERTNCVTVMLHRSSSGGKS